MAYGEPDQGWYCLGPFNKSELEAGLGEKLRDRFLSTIERPARGVSYCGEEFSEVLVRAYENIPRHLTLGGGFIPIGFLAEEPSQDYYNTLRKKLCQNQPDCIVSFVTTPGPGFDFSLLAPGKYEKNPTVKKIVWARWVLSNGEQVVSEPDI